MLTIDSQVKRLVAGRLPGPGRAGRAAPHPEEFSARSPRHRRDLVSTVRDKLADRDLDRPRRGRRDRAGAADDAEIRRLRRELRQHPCHGCDDREEHARWAERYFRLERETEALRRRVAGRSHVLARTFDGSARVLEELGYLDGDAVTPEGRRLAACTPSSTWSPPSACAAGLGRADPGRAGRVRVLADVRVPPARRRRAAPAAPAAG